MMNTSHSNPYIGPRTFLKEERDLFFGRDAEASDLEALVSSERLVLFYAQSGAGKSSLINARLIPSLEDKLFEVLPVARVSGEAPQKFEGDNLYIYNLIRSLIRRDTDLQLLSKLTLSKFLEKLNEDENGYFYDQDLTVSLRASMEGSPWPRALIVDQFEELFSTNVEAWQKREDFFCQLAQAMRDDHYLWVVLVMREDQIAALDPYAHLLPGGLRVRYYMQRLEQDAAVEAVRRPVENLRPYDPGVAEDLVKNLASIKVTRPDGSFEVQAGQYVEPVQLQVVCSNLWQNLEEGSHISQQDLLDVGDVDTSLGNYYAERVKLVAKEQNFKERKIREWFESKLISPSGVRTPVLKEQDGKSGGLDDHIVKALDDLVRGEQRGGATFFELTHDRLVGPIKENNRIWDAENSSPFRSQVVEWEKNEEDREKYLIIGPTLFTAQEWANKNEDILTDSEKNFLKASQTKQAELELDRQREHDNLLAAQKQAEERKLFAEEQQRLATQSRRVSRIAIVAFIIAAILGLVALGSSIQATNSKNEAVTAKAVAQEALTKVAEANNETLRYANDSRANELAADSQDSSTSFDQSILLSVAAYKISQENSHAQKALSKNAQQIYRVERIFSDPKNPAINFDVSHDGQILAIQGENSVSLFDQNGLTARLSNIDPSTKIYFSPDGATIALVDQTGIHLQNVKNADTSPGKAINYHPGRISEIVGSADGKALVILGDDNSIFRWEPGRETKSISLPIAIKSIALNQTGSIALATDEDNNTSFWDLLDQKQIGSTMPRYSVAFSPDGKLAASVKNDNSVSLINLRSGEETAILSGIAGKINKLIFDPEGDRYLAISDGTETALWDLKAADPLDRKLEGAPLIFSPNGNLFVSYEYYSGSQIFCIPENKISQEYISGKIEGFSHDSKVFAVSNIDGTNSLEMLTGACEATTTDAVPFNANTVLFSPASDVLASLDSEGTVRIQDYTNGYSSDVISPKQDVEETHPDGKLFFNPDGSLLMFSDGKTLLLWRMDTRERISLPANVLSEPREDIQFISNDTLLIRQRHGQIELLNVYTGDSQTVSVDVKGVIDNVMFDPAGNRILSIAQDTLFLIDLGSEVKPGPQIDGRFLAIDWKAGYLATSVDGKVILWDINTGKPKYDPLPGITAFFSPDDKKMVIADSSTIRVYDISNANKLKLIGKPVEFPLPSDGYDTNDYELKFSPKGTSFAIASKGPSSSKVLIYQVTSDAVKLLGTSDYTYGALMVFPSETSLLFQESSSSDSSYTYIDVLDWKGGYVMGNDESVTGSLPIAWDGKTLILGNQVSASLSSISMLDTEEFNLNNSPKVIETVKLDLNGSIRNMDFKFNTESNELFTRGEDGNIYKWNMDKDYKSEVTGSIGDVDKPVRTAVISPNGQKQAWFTQDGIILANTSGEQLPSAPFNQHILQIQEGAFNPDGNILAVKSSNDQTIFYDLQSMSSIGEPVDGILEPSQNKNIWITSSQNKTLWNASNGKMITEVENEPMSYSSDGTIFVTTDSEGNTIVNAIDGKKIGDPITGTFQAISPDGRYVAVKDIQDTQDGKEITVFWEVDNQDNEQHKSVSAAFVAFSPDSKYIAMKQTDGSLILLDSQTLEPSSQLIQGDFIKFSPMSKFMLYSFDGKVTLLNLAEQKPIKKGLTGDRFDFSPDDRILIMEMNSDPSTISIIDTSTGSQVGKSISGSIDSIRSFGTDSLPLIYSDDIKNELTLIDLKKGRINRPIPGRYAAESPDGKTIAVLLNNEDDTTISFWDRETGEILRSNKISYLGYEDFHFSPNAKTLIQSIPPGKATLIDVSNPASTSSIDADSLFIASNYEYAVAYSSKNNKVAVTLWNLSDRTTKDLSGVYPGVISNVIFSEDAKRLALLGNEGVVIWDIPKAGATNTEPLQEKSGMVDDLTFSADGHYLASLGTDGILIWNVAPTPTVYRTVPLDKRAIRLGFGSDSLIYLDEEYNIQEVDITSGNVSSLGKLVDNPSAICENGTAMSQDGSLIAYQIGHSVFIWNKQDKISTELPIENMTLDCTEYGFGSVLAFSPDKSKLAIGYGEQIYIGDTNDRKVMSHLSGKDIFSSASKIVFIDNTNLAIQYQYQSSELDAQGSTQAMIILWNVDSHSKIDEPFEGNLNELTSNSSLFLYRDNQERVFLQDLSPSNFTRYDKMRDKLCEIAGRNFSTNEWKQFFSQEHYPEVQENATCPQWNLDINRNTSTP